MIIIIMDGNNIKYNKLIVRNINVTKIMHNY